MNCSLFYNGIPLVKYCEENNIVLSTIKKRIAAIRKQEENRNLTVDEIVKINDGTLSLEFAKKYPGIETEKLADSVIKSGTSEDMYFFALQVKGAPIKKLEAL